MNLLAAASESSLPLWMVGAYLVALLGLGIFSSTLFRGTSKDYFVASRSIGPFMLLMSVFGTTMTGFALVGSTGKAFMTGVATFGAVAVWSVVYVCERKGGWWGDGGQRSITDHRAHPRPPSLCFGGVGGASASARSGAPPAHPL